MTSIEQPAKPYKIPVSTLVMIYTRESEVLLIERTDHPGYWQSVTGSQDVGETLIQTATREVEEETGIDATHFCLRDWNKHSVYDIYPIWRHRYAPNVSQNTEHVFGLLLPGRVPVRLNPREHLQHVWLPYDKAAPMCFSWSNREAIMEVPARLKE